MSWQQRRPAVQPVFSRTERDIVFFVSANQVFIYDAAIAQTVGSLAISEAQPTFDQLLLPEVTSLCAACDCACVAAW